ncbi:hypothetical protein [Dyadobacter sp. 3J3]|uniref:hypothetical protein n=1 Tax=Dyadobacter sp. 3J3 TaxID=2606600 RepID=UPI001E388F6C|nr:hypothetical protein [Dyadobacter sp. 3J3]
MIQRSDQGKLARMYFIECEKKLKQTPHQSISQSFSEAIRLAANQAEQIELQKAQIEEMSPKAAAADILLSSNRLNSLPCQSSTGIQTVDFQTRQNDEDINVSRNDRYQQKW